jgi:hypothetical protein
MNERETPEFEDYIQAPLTISDAEFQSFLSSQKITIRLSLREHENPRQTFRVGQNITLINVAGMDKRREYDPDQSRLVKITNVEPVAEKIHGEKMVDVTFELDE